MVLSWASFPVMCVLLTSFKMKVTVKRLTIYWGNWKHCMEDILKGDIRERDFLRRGNTEIHKKWGFIFSAAHRGAELTLYRRRTLLTSELYKHTIKHVMRWVKR